MAIAEVIKYDGSPDVFAWKYPNDSLGTWSQLIVNESQEAVLFKGGMALDVFGSGRHTLSTNNIPLLNKIVNLPFGKKSPFAAEIWFVNKVHSLDIKWGTATPIQLQDPKYGVLVPVRSFGQFGIKVEDSKKFLIKLVGTLPILDKNNLINFFKGLYLTKVKDSISSYLIRKQISIVEINAYIDELSTAMKERIAPTMDEYGLTLASFYVNDISVPENDLAVKKLREALAKRAEMDIIGYNYQQERSFDTLEGVAKNTSSGPAPYMGMGMGLGVGAGIGSAVGQQFGGITSQLNTQPVKKCPSCNVQMNNDARFCPSCGFDAQKSADKPSASKTKCSKCGASMNKETKFCPECGDKYNPCPQCGSDLLMDAVKCEECGYEFPLPCPACKALLKSKDTKFCPECGFSLIKKCPKCNAAIKGSPKFCPDCGEKL